MGKILFYLSIFCCIISQVFIVMECGYEDRMQMSLLLPFAFYLIKSPKLYFAKKLLGYYFFLILFVLFCFICESITTEKYIGADVTNIAISIFVLSVSYVFSCSIVDFNKNLNILALVFSAASFIYGLVIYLKFLLGADMFSTIYAFQEKNSAGQIILSSSIILYVLYNPEKKIFRYLSFIPLVLMLFWVFLIKSRATLVGFFFVILYYIFAYKDKKVRLYLFVLCSLFLLYMYNNEGLSHIIVDGILFANRDATDLNDLSSGRADNMGNYIDLFLSDSLIGIGNRYFDCFPLIILVQYGILGSLIIFPFVINRIKDCVALNKESEIELCAFLLMSTYLLNSLFEAQAPFGPGVKCLPLWIIWGIMLGHRAKSRTLRFRFGGEYET